MGSLRRFEGRILIDHSQSPGVDAHPDPRMRLDSPIVAAGSVYESATITCCHCATIVVLNPQRTRARGYCAKCDHYVCDQPGCNAECSPFQKTLDHALTSAALLID
jgi:hypothetical protein